MKPLLTATIESVLVDTLKELRNAEAQLRVVLPRLWDSTQNTALAALLRRFLQQSTQHDSLLAGWQDTLHTSSEDRQWAGMEMSVRDTLAGACSTVDDGMRDLLIINGSQRIKGLKMATYGTARSLAEACGHVEMAESLADILTTEMEGDLELVEIGHRLLHPGQLLVD